MTKLTWPERFALIDHYKPSDAQICTSFKINPSDLHMARQLRTVGTLSASNTFDAPAHGNPFTAPVTETVTSTKRSTSPVSSKTTSDVSAPPRETASKKVVAPKKRGRKGTKISAAFSAIPATPVDLTQFASQYNVSIPVLRQSKRFDTAPELGTVRVKVNKDNGNLEIWREPVEA